VRPASAHLATSRKLRRPGAGRAFGRRQSQSDAGCECGRPKSDGDQEPNGSLLGIDRGDCTPLVVPEATGGKDTLSASAPSNRRREGPALQPIHGSGAAAGGSLLKTRPLFPALLGTPISVDGRTALLGGYATFATGSALRS